LDQGIIVVTMNYRLYLLGFLSLGIPEVPGNQGLLDQLMALKMVQSDIHKFGGDPEQVTLAGQSAGSSSALYHVQSPRSKGLFKRVIAESGSNFSPSLHSITAEEAVGFGKESCDAVGCIIGGNSPHARLDCLQGHSLDGLVRLTSVIGINIKPNEDKAYADEPFMPMSPMDALKSGSYNQDVDVLIGTNLNDGLILTTPLYTTPSLYFLYRHLWGVIAPGILFHLPVGDSNFDSTHKANQLADFYLGGTKNIVPENFDKITDMFTDAFVTYAVECFAKHAQTTQKVFHYKYVHQGQYGLNTDANLPKLGVNHADELYLMWEPIYDKEHPLNPEDQAMSDLIVPAWANFIKTGDPGIAEWKAREVNVGEKYFVLNTTDSHMERSDEYQKRMQFWESIFPC